MNDLAERVLIYLDKVCDDQSLTLRDLADPASPVLIVDESDGRGPQVAKWEFDYPKPLWGDLLTISEKNLKDFRTKEKQTKFENWPFYSVLVETVKQIVKEEIENQQK